MTRSLSRCSASCSYSLVIQVLAPRMRADVPPQIRVVLEEPGPHAAPYELLELLKGSQRRRKPTARHRLEHLAAR